MSLARFTSPPRFVLALCALSVLGLLHSCASGRGGAPIEEEQTLYPDPPDPPRVQFLRSVSVESDIGEGPSRLDDLLFGEEKIHKGLMAPYGVAVRDGIVYICDIQQSCVLTLDFSGRRIGLVEARGRAKLQKPVNLDFADDGTMFVADVGRRQVVHLGRDGSYLGEYGPWGDDSRPADVEVAGDDLWIADSGAGLVRRIDRESKEEEVVFGERVGERPGLKAPTNLDCDENGNVYVVDTIQCRIGVWNAEGEFVRWIGGVGDTIGSFARPKGIACYGRLLFVVDAAFENVQVFDLNGTPLMFFGGPGTGPGDMYLPAGIYVGTEGIDLFRDRLLDGFVPEALIVVTNLYGPRKSNYYAFGTLEGFDYPPADLPAAPEPGPEDPESAEAGPESAPQDGGI